MSVVNNNNNTCDRFQESVSQLLIKHKSILDVLTKQQESITRVNRAIVDVYKRQIQSNHLLFFS